MWKDSLKNNITTIDEISRKMHLAPRLQQEMETIIKQFPMSVSAYYFSLINWDDDQDPIRKMCLPSLAELDMAGRLDTSGEALNTKLTGIQHKYRETALILSTNICATYCRHCFRRRVVGISENEITQNFDAVADYVRVHNEISNVLLSGGDSFLMENDRIEQYLKTYTAIDHLDFIRFGTRTPVTFPERISTDPELLDMLSYYNLQKQICIVTHFNHPNEITKQSAEAIKKLRDCGIPIRNQTVLLRGVNDDGVVLGNLMKGLISIGVIPYYVFQCRPVSGVGAHFQVPLLEGYKIVEKAKSMQNGIGKCFRYVMSHETGKIELIGPDADGSMIMKYHQAKDPNDIGRIFKTELQMGQKWID